MNAIIDWAKAHPRLTAWLVLGLGMDGMVAYEAKDVGLQVTQWIALIVATTLVAGLCVWIIGWEDDEDEATAAAASAKPAASAELATGAKTAPNRVSKKPAAKKTATRSKSASRKTTRR
jgi:hypothetical protein